MDVSVGNGSGMDGKERGKWRYSVRYCFTVLTRESDQRHISALKTDNSVVPPALQSQRPHRRTSALALSGAFYSASRLFLMTS